MRIKGNEGGILEEFAHFIVKAVEVEGKLGVGHFGPECDAMGSLLMDWMDC